MKRISILTLLFLAFSLASFNSYSQPRNTIVHDTAIDKEVLYGYCDREGLLGEVFENQFTEEYNQYQPEPGIIDDLSRFKMNYEIIIVFGSWCEDSRREIPRFYRILDDIGFEETNLKLIGIDKSKSAGNIEMDVYKIEKVPTFIIYSKGKEIGRITEIPETNLEMDLIHILHNNINK